MVPPKTYLSNKFSGIYIVFLSIWTLKLMACFGDQKLQFCASLFPSHPFRNTSGSRFKIQDPKETSWIQGVGSKIQDPKKTYWIQGDRIQDSRSPQKNWIRRPSALNLESKEVGLKKFFLSLEPWVLNPKRFDWRIFSEPWILNLESGYLEEY